MSRGMKIGLVVGVLALAAGGGVAYSMNKKKNAGTEVRLEQVSRRDLVAAVTASGKIEPQTSVDISADITGRIIRIAVEEGDRVTKGQFLLQIDPAQYQAAVSRAEGVVSSTQATLLQVRANRDQAERALEAGQRADPAGTEPDLARGRRRGPDGSRRGGGDLPGHPGAAGSVAGGPQGGPGQPGQDPARLPHRRAGGAPRGRGGRSGGARHLLSRDRPAAHDRRPVGDPGQGAGGRDRRRAAHPQATRSRSPSTPIPTRPSSAG